jgi:hypothetical protein
MMPELARVGGIVLATLPHLTPSAGGSRNPVTGSLKPPAGFSFGEFNLNVSCAGLASEYASAILGSGIG